MNKKSKKVLGVVTSLVLSLCMLTGCSSNNSASSNASSSQSSNKSAELPKKINITYVKAPLNVPSILEKNDSLFDEEFKSDNIELNWPEITAGPDQTEALASGDIDFAHCLGGTSALIAASNGVNLKIIGTYSQAPKGFMLVTNDKSIKGPEDLKGKKIGGPKGTILHQVLVAALKEKGMTINDVEFMDMQIPDAVTSLGSGKIDCALVAGPSALQCLNSGSTKVCDGEGLVSGITVIAVNSDFAEKYPDLVKRFMKVHDETLDYMEDNYDEMISKVAKELEISEDDVKSLYEWYDFDDDIDEEEIQALYDTQDFLIENDMQQNKIKIEDYILDVK
ncbi:NrtA/SsuA/CpmA family ABC transporter substrate-binding protein [Intestinibacter sp.]